MRRKWTFILGNIVLCAGLILHPFFNGKAPALSYLHSMVWGNKIEIETSDDIDESRIVVVFKNEFAMVQERNKLTFGSLKNRFGNESIIDTIFMNGEQLSDIPYDYGKQVLIVSYDHKELGRLELWKTNNWHSHRYKINVKRINGEVTFLGSVRGPDESN